MHDGESSSHEAVRLALDREFGPVQRRGLAVLFRPRVPLSGPFKDSFAVLPKSAEPSLGRSQMCAKTPRVQESRLFRCATTVPESDVFKVLRLALSGKQIPQVVENIEK